MKMRTTLKAALIALAFSTFSHHAFAQGNVSVVHLSVQPGANGEMVITPRGIAVPLPGAGVAGNVVDIYMGSNGGYWYVDRNGQTTDLTGYVAEMRARMGGTQSAAPQYSPYGAAAYQQQPVYQNTQQTTSNSSGSSALGTAAAAGVGSMMGAMAGTAMMGGYNNVPYGTPMYYGANNQPYYRDGDGKNVFVNDDGQVKWNNVAAAKSVQDNRQQQQIDQAKSFHQQMQANAPAAAAGGTSSMERTAPDYSRQGQQFQQQQQWYQNRSSDPKQAQAWRDQSAGENPFVRGGQNADGGERREAFQNNGGGERERRFGGGDGGRDFGAGRAARGGRMGRFGR